ncbi:MAG: hypothetical protein A2655_03280 [Candidatus Yanofskybacteria bacterium RIFCSPHIGHO2_01_FULL_43_42]|uniref:Phosphoribosyltransferase domain-containing protein n=1 Tax=Candidatus Yanofskybacteria bacterium RIFCSPLOWO2_01_FULL_43_22 TaxID=1802695 RepID=A0A1F8GHI4_9BACT|nr:MAG: hypothetical protein A2655_03280 [Candidatus Yanofskybacteria bacterium RIFCSPHIGHO2_01_FULL_43_42]OGN13020.1 MAG: hypothetical protein A3D48_03940 [Candidatus Yanofskybacteria bacterium RIFCSPHIGHO2_02_FULL_43_17]OGN23899.1 MAG: hypothetical protein A3A13_02315 [Candidatus Yanofskybacteria bacterium RIFCSPLOWO2_01_FULL_43_22]
MPNYPQRLVGWILDTIFPKICLGCGKFTRLNFASQNLGGFTDKKDFDYVCRKCFGEIDLKNTFECIGCKRQTQLGLTCTFCKKDNYIDQLLIAAELTDPLVEKILKAYKYKFICDMAMPLSMIAKKCVKRLLSKGFVLFESNPILVPVPLSGSRLNWRGFNQAQLLARSLSDGFLASCGEGVLARINCFRHQADIQAKEDRINNVKDNFAVKDSESIRGRTVILVDDICTTGATLNECARVLKNPPAGGGARRVIGFVIARGQFKR